MTTVTRPKNFTGWLGRQRRRDDPVGDLARDARQDVLWPRTARTLAAFQRHLQDQRAIEPALDALERAWSEYQTARGISS